MIDSGVSSKRSDLVNELERLELKPGNLILIIVTHGDSDHCGNSRFLREKFGGKIAMHPAEAEMVKTGNMLLSRKPKQTTLRRLLIKAITPFVRLKEVDQFEADLFIEDEADLSPWGLSARVLEIPGHSNGSIGILTRDGTLFCGDLIDNNSKPRLHMIDDPVAAVASLEKLSNYPVKIVYPGHGDRFSFDQLNIISPAS